MKKNHLRREVPSRIPSNWTPELLESIYASLSTPLSLELLDSLKNQNYGKIVSASIDPMDYSNADAFRQDYLAVNVFSKFDSFDLGVDRRSVAISKFFEAEAVCKKTNSYLQSRDFSSIELSPAAVIITARRKIERLLGEFDLDALISNCSFGPGASTSLSRRCGDAYYKFGNPNPQATPLMRPYVNALTKWAPNWNPQVEYVHGSRITTVPKNAKTDRLIAIEPDINMFFQKGMGKLIRARLRSRAGLLLPDAQRRNAELARLGSTDGELATVDLSMASDTISYEVVKELLPPIWFDHLNRMRSHFCYVDGEIHHLHKFSSMGNGFTFELETLIFWAISSSVLSLTGSRDRRLSVYGDDIILPSTAVASLKSVLADFGFSLNDSKSFWTGPFRESCGKHYFRGVDVSPFFIRSPLVSFRDVFKVLNLIHIWSRTSWGLSPEFSGLHTEFSTRLRKIRKWMPIPDGFPLDSGVIVDFDTAVPKKAPRGFEGWRVRYFIDRKRVHTKYDHPILLKRLHNTQFDESEIHPVTSFGVKLSSSTSPQWPSFGPFLS